MSKTHKMCIPILNYDVACPVCKSFAKLIRKKITPDLLVIKPLANKPDSEMTYQRNEAIYTAKAAVNALVEDFPQIKEYFWMLPASYRHEAVLKTHKFGAWIRQHIFRQQDCNCPKKPIKKGNVS